MHFKDVPQSLSYAMYVMHRENKQNNLYAYVPTYIHLPQMVVNTFVLHVICSLQRAFIDCDVSGAACKQRWLGGAGGT